MKRKLTTLLIATAVLLSLVACGRDSQLKQLVKEMNKECPIDMGAFGTMDNVVYEDNVLFMNYTVNEGYINLDDFRANEKAIHDNQLVAYANNPDKSFQKLIKSIVKAGADLKVVYRTAEGDNFEILFTNKELKASMADNDADPEALLQKSLAITRLQLPYEADEGIQCTDVELDNDYCTYVYICDEEIYDMEVLKESLEESRDEFKDEILDNSDDIMMARLVRMIKETGRGLRYKYVGNATGMEAEIVIENNEM